ncbi:ubiquitin-2 like Rad60 SUMO-like-domain-containing protein [Colletotrichum godetiae]|uniref:Ubiquitin-2 like Rad60 SUMO-like-domain-containing protein n=1 Tax=Colletotrichum godetiae TaxID=1209918 RepID=A0AAJ0AUE6_9PEZI|nr:ubiquitin-2 like Rad60 SUMO-like-domain-containing protein [Colletotrichum godetiae]KAK1688324.1 ubiquitin-2 like Rad60 SUMO-like-domain-containing protein [Colletotrichum godetiae]
MADAAKPKRRLPFKPTALRQKSDPKPAPQENDDEEDDDDDGLSLFKRSAEFFPVAVAEQERRMKRKQAEREKSSQARSPERETQPAPRASEEPGKDDVEEDTKEIGTPPSKRSRTSDESPQSRTKQSPYKRREGTETPSKRLTRAAASRTPRKQQVIPHNPVIAIEDSDEDLDDVDDVASDDIYEASPVRKTQRRRQTSEPEASPLVIDSDDPFVEGMDEDKKSPVAVAVEEEEEDDEFEEYVRRAMERKKALEQNENQLVNVFVTSDIPDTRDRQFRFTLVKPLKVIRMKWIEVQLERVQMSHSELESVFLTWRGHELYDTTTLHSLDLEATFRKYGGGDGGGDLSEGFKDDDWTNVHLQMWTRELWEEHERQEARRRRHDLGDYSDDEGEAQGDGADAIEPETEQKIKVLLKTKTDEPLKTSVRPSTTIGTLMELFRKMRGLAADAPITLMFDGDELEEEMTVEEADIGDMETIEVYIR